MTDLEEVTLDRPAQDAGLDVQLGYLTGKLKEAKTCLATHALDENEAEWEYQPRHARALLEAGFVLLLDHYAVARARVLAQAVNPKPAALVVALVRALDDLWWFEPPTRSLEVGDFDDLKLVLGFSGPTRGHSTYLLMGLQSRAKGAR